MKLEDYLKIPYKMEIIEDTEEGDYMRRYLD